MGESELLTSSGAIRGQIYAVCWVLWILLQTNNNNTPADNTSGWILPTSMYLPRPAVHWHHLDPDTEYIYCWNSSLEMVLGDSSHSFAYHQWWVFIPGGCIQFEERTKSHDDLNLELYMIWQRIIVFDENNYKIIFPLSSMISLTDIIESKNFSFGRIRGNNVRYSQTTSCWMIFGPSKLSSEFGVSISYIQGLLKKRMVFQTNKISNTNICAMFFNFSEDLWNSYSVVSSPKEAIFDHSDF